MYNLQQPHPCFCLDPRRREMGSQRPLSSEDRRTHGPPNSNPAGPAQKPIRDWVLFFSRPHIRPQLLQHSKHFHPPHHQLYLSHLESSPVRDSNTPLLIYDCDSLARTFFPYKSAHAPPHLHLVCHQPGAPSHPVLYPSLLLDHHPTPTTFSCSSKRLCISPHLASPHRPSLPLLHARSPNL